MAKGWPKGKPQKSEQADEPIGGICGNCARLLYRDPIGRGICEVSRKPKDPHEEKCTLFAMDKNTQKTKETVPAPNPPRQGITHGRSPHPLNRMRVYISGKISGLHANEVEAKFAQAAAQIRAFGHEPVNPINNGLGAEASWNEHLVADVALLLECDAIYLLKDWGDSRGSRIEANIAEECGLQIVHQPEYATYESRM